MKWWHSTSDIKRQKLEALIKFEGREVILGVGAKAIFDQVGTLQLESEGSVTLANAKIGAVRTIRLSDIRWVVDPQTRSRVAGPW